MKPTNNFLIQGLAGGPASIKPGSPDDKYFVSQSIIDGDHHAVSGNAVHDGFVKVDLHVRDIMSNISTHIVESPEMDAALAEKVPDTIKQEVIIATDKMPDSKITNDEVNGLFDENGLFYY